MPVAIPPEDPSYTLPPDPSVIAGYTDCLKEALKFLLEKEKLPPQHPVVAGLALHLARPAARNSLRKLGASPQRSTRLERGAASKAESSSERSLHQIRHTVNIGKTRIVSVHKNGPSVVPIVNPRDSEVVASSHLNQANNRLQFNEHSQSPDNDRLQNQSSRTISSQQQGSSNASQRRYDPRNVNNELRKNLQTIVENLQDAIEGSQSEDEGEDSSYEEDGSDKEGNDDAASYDVDDNDIDTEIDTILGDTELRRELVRLVYQGCDLVVPQRTVHGYPSPPASPQYATVATPQYFPDEHVIQHIRNDRL